MPGARFCPPTDPRYTFVGSDYGPRPSRSSGETDFHPGLDFNFNADTETASRLRIGSAFEVPISSVADGRVVFVGYDRAPQGQPESWSAGYGNCVLVEHSHVGPSPVGGPWYTLYAHLRDFRVRIGTLVTAGEIIARMGASMNNRFTAMGPHLHFEVRTQLRNPSSATGSQVPIPGTNDPAFVDWQVGRRTFHARPRAGTTVDPIWWLAERGVHVLRSPQVVDGVERRRGTILLGQGTFGSGAMPIERVADYQPAQLPQTASYRAPRRSGMAGLGATPPDSVTIAIEQQTGSGSREIVGTTEPYQPPVAGRLANPLIPVTDPSTQAPASGYAVAGVAAVGGLCALALGFEAYRAMRGHSS